ncbi:hypothetical protein MA16_Dca010944 [Dendrobium catenatum]|uniref:Uncharacterized protein n=1 Tax=Dendrobium catenatum TaxID=906689 RepID=A0A2I0WVN1_9ASPA|nr:hypothetical protein MA16_Dca010944 [Dendrobium catenatum]
MNVVNMGLCDVNMMVDVKLALSDVASLIAIEKALMDVLNGLSHDRLYDSSNRVVVSFDKSHLASLEPTLSANVMVTNESLTLIDVPVSLIFYDVLKAQLALNVMDYCVAQCDWFDEFPSSSCGVEDFLWA